MVAHSTSWRRNPFRSMPTSCRLSALSHGSSPQKRCCRGTAVPKNRSRSEGASQPPKWNVRFLQSRKKRESDAWSAHIPRVAPSGTDGYQRPFPEITWTSMSSVSSWERQACEDSAKSTENQKPVRSSSSSPSPLPNSIAKRCLKKDDSPCFDKERRFLCDPSTWYEEINHISAQPCRLQYPRQWSSSARICLCAKPRELDPRTWARSTRERSEQGSETLSPHGATVAVHDRHSFTTRRCTATATGTTECTQHTQR